MDFLRDIPDRASWDWWIGALWLSVWKAWQENPTGALTEGGCVRISHPEAIWGRGSGGSSEQKTGDRVRRIPACCFQKSCDCPHCVALALEICLVQLVLCCACLLSPQMQGGPPGLGQCALWASPQLYISLFTVLNAHAWLWCQGQRRVFQGPIPIAPWPHV